MTADDGRALPGHLRSIQPTSQFAGDDGSADPELAALLEGYAAGATPLRDVVARLAATRVLVPVLAEVEATGTVEHEGAELHVDKEASAGVVALQAPDGRRALPVFTSVDAMRAWRADARPVPVEAPRAALSAVSEDWALLVVDPAGPVTALVPRPAVWALAQGQQWRPALEPTADGLTVEAEVAGGGGVQERRWPTPPHPSSTSCGRTPSRAARPRSRSCSRSTRAWTARVSTGCWHRSTRGSARRRSSPSASTRSSCASPRPADAAARGPQEQGGSAENEASSPSSCRTVDSGMSIERPSDVLA
ncbi:type III secretion system (T3SS) SseB-like protein [Isoptericola variabilis J7]|uniref:SseB family protein n=2 Tax=Isoptericola variabilis TaxID=139208 RepID=UPI0011ADE5A7|nr:SseB family protein [Isoptericola variabilis]TWH28776.1 type III secretion system (T3SS) SseB-like protein [Isoptericola variabilis J7]